MSEKFCDSCKWWGSARWLSNGLRWCDCPAIVLHDSDDGMMNESCKKAAEYGGAIVVSSSDGSASFATAPKFGCIHWTSK